MAKIFGDYIEAGDTMEYLIISFSSKSLPIQERWRTNSLSADFLADYWGSFFPVHDPKADSSHHEVRDAVSYIVNELLENAIKFSDEESGIPVRIGLYLTQKALRFYVSNSIAAKKIAPFQDYIDELLTEDTDELYLRQLENNAEIEDESQTESGLGLLTVINDYSAKVGWKFEETAEEKEIEMVTTMVGLEIVRKQG